MSDFTDIEDVFIKFDYFLNIYERDYKTVTAEEILSIFKCSLFIENSAKKFNDIDLLNKFLEAFHLWHEKKNKFKVYESNLFIFACDYSLEKLFKSKISINSLDIAIRIYSSMHSQERFQGFLEKYLKTQLSFKAIKNFVLANNETDTFACKIILTVWTEYYNMNLLTDLENLIEYSLTDYRLNHIILKHITILNLNTTNKSEEAVKKLILEQLETHMKVRNKLMENFWMIIFFEINPIILSNVCNYYSSFLDLLFKFIIYVGSMMNLVCVNDKYKWVNNNQHVTFCPKITYANLISFNKSILIHDNVIEFAHNTIKNMRNNVECKIWKDIYNDVFLNKK